MKFKIYLLLSILFISTLNSCKKSNYKNDIIDAYKKEAENYKTTILISELEIINSRKIGIEYLQNLQIDDMNFVINNNLKIIKLLEENISLYSENIEHHSVLSKKDLKNSKKYLKEIESDEYEIKKTLIEIEKFKNEIRQYKYDINNIKEETNPELYDKEFTLIKHYLNAKLASQTVNDTIDMLFDENMKYLDHIPLIFD